MRELLVYGGGAELRKSVADESFQLGVHPRVVEEGLDVLNDPLVQNLLQGIGDPGPNLRGEGRVKVAKYLKKK